jgi:hypothetical protein
MVEPKKAERTSSLLRRLFNTSDLEEFMENNADDMNLPFFHVYITDLCSSQGKVPEQVIRQAAIERSYGHQLFNGTRKPSRDKVIQLAFGLELDLEGTQKLLQIAQKNPLYPKIKRDAAILYCINNQKDILETQSVLLNLGLSLLGGE